MFKEEILENERRHKIYLTIKSNPGSHIRQLQRLLDIPLASLQYHLNYMARRNVIIEEKSEHYTRYYCSPLDPEEKKLLSVLRQKRLREIVMIILVAKKAKYRSIVDTTGLPASTISFYLRCLMDSDVVERTKIGYENVYTIKDEEKIGKVLIAYQSSFLDSLVDKWANTWFEPSLAKDKPETQEHEQDS